MAARAAPTVSCSCGSLSLGKAVSKIYFISLYASIISAKSLASVGFSTCFDFLWRIYCEDDEDYSESESELSDDF